MIHFYVVLGFFGAVKNQWRMFSNGLIFHSPFFITDAFKTCACLHNMILKFCRSDGQNWENVRWDKVDADVDNIFNGVPWDPVDEDDIRVDNDIFDGIDEDEGDDNISTVTEHPVVPTQPPATPTTVVTITPLTPKRHLKDILQKSFTVQWIRHLLEWPRSMATKDRQRMPMVRATMEINRALRGGPSHLRGFNPTTNLYTRLIGRGLFSMLGYRKDEVIATFHGGKWCHLYLQVF